MMKVILYFQVFFQKEIQTFGKSGNLVIPYRGKMNVTFF